MNKPFPHRFPIWPSILVLVGLPSLYVFKDRLTLADTLAENLPRVITDAIERPRFVAFWAIVLLLHAASVFLVMMLLKFNRLPLKEIGLKSPPRRVMLVFGGLLVTGIGLVLFRTYAPLGDIFTRFGRHLPDIYAIDLFQRGGWVVISLGAGFCEELVYRGFGITALVDRGLPINVAVILTSLSFMVMHGIGAPVQMLAYFGGGILFAMVYLISKDLLNAMAFHAGYDLLAIMVQ